LALLLAGCAMTFFGNAHLMYILGTVALLAWARLAVTSSEYRRLWTYVSTPVVLLGSGGR
jgi:hypothetical protein